MSDFDTVREFVALANAHDEARRQAREALDRIEADWNEVMMTPGGTYQKWKQAEAELTRLRGVIERGIEAVRLTHEYVGDVLPQKPGWSLYDWTQEARAALPNRREWVCACPRCLALDSTTTQENPDDE